MWFPNPSGSLTRPVYHGSEVTLVGISIKNNIFWLLEICEVRGISEHGVTG